jgi:gliding motility-associated-like protein
MYNNGNIRIHDGGNLGFHTDLINDSPFDDNSGLAGFYGSAITVSGSVVPLFFDVESATGNGLFLELGIDNANNTNFISRNIFTPRTQPNVYYNFLENSFYTGDGDLTKIDGYSGITNQQNFIFPVGDDQQLRPLVLTSESVNLTAKCAYFFENTGNPVSLSGSFNVDELDLDLEFVSPLEFWRLEGSVASTVSLSWNARSDISALTDDATKVVVAGWSKVSNRWINLGGNPVLGTLEEGFVTSEAFIPDDYEIITLGVSKIPFEPLEREVLSLDNYFVSPNGDGINDTFFIPELLQSPNNEVRIYDRYGLKVFEMDNYTDEFSGFSNVNNFVIQREDGLPVGVYFYTIYMIDLDLNYQGFLYLAR